MADGSNFNQEPQRIFVVRGLETVQSWRCYSAFNRCYTNQLTKTTTSISIPTQHQRIRTHHPPPETLSYRHHKCENQTRTHRRWHLHAHGPSKKAPPPNAKRTDHHHQIHGTTNSQSTQSCTRARQFSVATPYPGAQG